jgi:hypothetical protein
MSTVADLKQLAKARGFSGYSKLKKAELLNLLGVTAGAKKARNCKKTIKVTLIPYLQSDTAIIQGSDLTPAMMKHIKKVVAEDYQYADGDGHVKVTVRQTKNKRFHVTLCGKNILMSALNTVDDDGNRPYSYKGQNYFVSFMYISGFG